MRLLRSTFVRIGRELGKTSRLILAIKTAVAASLAWYLAPFVPFAESEYSYYAPLGVLVSMYATLFDSVRSGMQAVLGLSAGIILGLGGLYLVSEGAPAIIAVALVVVVGVALGGLHVFGVGREWISVSGLFVLLLGGRDASEFSLSYLVTMAFGVVVGVLMQLMVAPPLFMREAHARLTDLRRSLSSCLQEASAIVAGDQHQAQRLQLTVDDLIETVAAVTEDVQEARQSQRANPRARKRRTERRSIDNQFRGLDRAVFFVRALAGHVEHRIFDRESVGRPGDEQLAKAINQCSILVTFAADSSDREEQVKRARESVEEFFSTIDSTNDIKLTRIANELAAGTCLQRVIDVIE